MKAKFRGKIINALRKLTWSWEPYSNVKKSSKIDIACYKCSCCSKYCYDGKSQSTYENLVEKYPNDNVQRESIYIDHIDPVIKLEHWDWDWNEFVNRLFCSEDNLQALCKQCHDEKTKEENKIRKELKDKHKKENK